MARITATRTAGNQHAPQRSPRVRRWSERLIQSDRWLRLLFVASFAETVIVPIPIELVLVPFMVARRDIIWRSALAATSGCLAASALGYGIGYFLFESLGRMLVDTLGLQSGFEQFRSLFHKHGFFAILAIGVLPIPFQTAMLVAGMTHYSIVLFVIAATIARGIRYFGLGWLVCRYGHHAEGFYRGHSNSTTLVLGAVIILTWALATWLGGR